MYLSWQHWQIMIWCKWHVRCMHHGMALLKEDIFVFHFVIQRRYHIWENNFELNHVWLWLEPVTLLKPRHQFSSSWLFPFLWLASFPTAILFLVFLFCLYSPVSLILPYLIIHFGRQTTTVIPTLPPKKYNSFLPFWPAFSPHLTSCTVATPFFMPVDPEMRQWKLGGNIRLSATTRKHVLLRSVSVQLNSITISPICLHWMFAIALPVWNRKRARGIYFVWSAFSHTPE